jgi:hypothetical protein
MYSALQDIRNIDATIKPLPKSLKNHTHENVSPRFTWTGVIEK